MSEIDSIFQRFGQTNTAKADLTCFDPEKVRFNVEPSVSDLGFDAERERTGNALNGRVGFELGQELMNCDAIESGKKELMVSEQFQK